ncbi:AIPR family protein [Mesorhizobium sp. M0684]|uniref:AIPR family protein n=1 Tax=unclassified Mesorhizobium TaxID=325217 RepID=UPI003338B94C
MESAQLESPNFASLIERFTAKGFSEGKSFTLWFLENIYRLDAVDAADAVCDAQNDKGVDAIWVDELNKEIHIFQSKTTQNNNSKIGDNVLKTFIGTLSQFDTSHKVSEILDGNANQDLKNLLQRQSIGPLVDKGYKVVGIFVTNQLPNADTEEFLAKHDSLILYDRAKIANDHVDLETEGGIDDKYTFSVSYAGCLNVNVGKQAEVFVFPVSATAVTGLKGIGDASLFKRNVRYSLGNTDVNKSITASVRDKAEHLFFPLYHNGITIICRYANLDTETEEITISNYVVVNGAQSLTTFYNNSKFLSEDLRIFVKVISLNDERLSRKITLNSNNQNAIKAKDLRSDDDLMNRLSQEFAKGGYGYNFEIKRGEKFGNDGPVISNDEAGRMLLAFDLRRPFSCHQIYKVFDENYSEIFGRPEVDAQRIVFLRDLMNLINEEIKGLKNGPMSSYALTKYFILSVVREIIDTNQNAKLIANSKKLRDNAKYISLFKALKSIVPEIINDLNHLVDDQSPDFDYKADLKSPEKTKAWRLELLRTYEKDVKRSKATSLVEYLA